MSNTNPNSEARSHALKFLYQCEIDKLYFFSDSHFNSFFSYFEIKDQVKRQAKILVEGVFSEIETVDSQIAATSKRWSLDRMSIIDRSILRLGTYELLKNTAPIKVVINECIELAKTFGAENSSGFVNGILDTIAKNTIK